MSLGSTPHQTLHAGNGTVEGEEWRTIHPRWQESVTQLSGILAEW